ncbi:MAG: hypothetical protein sL5_05070 [Candidatus Mesenet longicola]|uniref:Ankyrin repeat domain-containing protein n=1 Tax=Candidatus Mesenet longicola TaxID=1892558 RepID=A0A8J3HP65_9RICK|nr:MAG: hypothetical protein sGL2_05000 [Candidatus Mesenet longicola]GHM59514.1 MAG: hypothetical protein sL5_05070 [Candidatus Mesenet longicola]
MDGISEAYRILSNPEEKKKYDEVLEKQQPRKQFYTYNNNRDYLKSCVDLLKESNFEKIKDLLAKRQTSLDEILKVSADPKDVHINDKGRVGHTPLHFAVHNNNVDVVKILLKIPDIDINALLESDYQSNSAIGCAKNAEMILMLVNAGADIESEKGKRDLTGVINNLIEEEKSEEVIKLLSDELLKDKIDLNTEAWYGDNDDGITILEAATLKYNTKLLKVLSKHRPSANLKGINEPHYQDLIMCHLAEEHSKTKNKAEKNKIKDTMTLLVLFFNADLTLKDDKRKTPLDYLKDESFKKYLEEDVAKLRANINKTCGTNPTDFILNYFEQNPGKSIENCVKDLSENLDQLVSKYKDDPSTSFNAAKIEEKGKSYTIM